MSKNIGSVRNEGAVLVDNEQVASGLKKSSIGFAGSVMALSGGAIVAQGLGIITAPIVTRLFAPEAFGLAAVFTSIVGMVGIVGCFTYELAIVLPKDDGDAANVFALCFTFVVAITAFVVLLTGLFGSYFLGLFEGGAELEPYKWLIPSGIFLASLGIPLRYWNTRHKHFKRLAAVRIETATIILAMRLGLGFLGFTTGLCLIVCGLFGLAAIPVILGLYLWPHDLPFILKAFAIKKMWRLAKRYKKFPLIHAWSGLLNTVSQEIPTILVVFYFGVATGGLYSLAKRLVSMPGNLVSAAAGQVFYQRAALAKTTTGDLAWLVENFADRLAAIGLLPMLIVVMTGPDLFRFVLGQRWADAGVYAAILAIWLFFMFVSGPMSHLYTVLERQGLALFFNVAIIGSRIAALVVGGAVFRDVVWALLLFSLVGVFFNVLQIVILTRLVKASIAVIMKSFILYFNYAVPTIIIIGCCRWLLHLSALYVLLASIVGCLPYVVLVLRHDKELRAAFYKVAKKIVLRIRSVKRAFYL